MNEETKTETTKPTSAELNAKAKENTIGRTGYEAYMRATGGATYDGRQMPPWPNLPASVQMAWEASAKAILERGAPPRSAEES